MTTNDGLLYLLGMAGQTIAALEARVHELETQVAELQAEQSPETQEPVAT